MNNFKGPKIFQCGEYKVQRQDLEVTNKKNEKLATSLYDFIDDQDTQIKRNCIIYLHCNGGCRIEATQIAPYILKQGIMFCCFDFSGSGVSEGEYVSLGVFETEDTLSIIEYIKSLGKVNQIGLWGRSMGAVTSIITASKCSDVKIMACDSPFSSLKQLSIDVAKKNSKIPRCFLSIFMIFVKRSIYKKAKFNISQLGNFDNIMHQEMKKYAKNNKIDALFAASEQDTFINFKNTIKIHNEHKGKKQIYYFNGEHNAQRQKEFFQHICDFFVGFFNIQDNIVNFNEIYSYQQQKIQQQDNENQILLQDQQNKINIDPQQVNLDIQTQQNVTTLQENQIIYHQNLEEKEIQIQI